MATADAHAAPSPTVTVTGASKPASRSSASLLEAPIDKRLTKESRIRLGAERPAAPAPSRDSDWVRPHWERIDGASIYRDCSRASQTRSIRSACVLGSSWLALSLIGTWSVTLAEFSCTDRAGLGHEDCGETVVKRFALVVVGVVMVGLAGLGVAGVFGFTPFRQSDEGQPAVLVSIQEIHEYHAAVGNFEVVLDTSDQDLEWAPAFISGRRSIFQAVGTVDAYVDFSGLADGDLELSEDGKSVTIRLPEAQLAKPNLDQGRTHLVWQDRGILDQIADFSSAPDQAELYSRAEEKLAAAAEGTELKKTARENTKAMLTSLCGSLGITAKFVE